MRRLMYVGVDIGGTHLRAALIDDDGGIVELLKTSSTITKGPEQISARLEKQCLSLMQSAQALRAEVAAVGIGAAGKIDPYEGTVLFSPNLPQMNGYPLAPEIQERTGLPVVLDNDANMFGIGEGWKGAGRGIRNWVGLTLGTGVGGCLILDEKLWRGDDLGFVGEIGHTIVDPGGPRCVCGLKGCLEAHASGRALVEGMRERGFSAEAAGRFAPERANGAGLDAEAVYRLARTGHPLALRLFQRMGWALGIAIANLFSTLAIRHAIIGGGVSASWDQFIGHLMQSLSLNCCMLGADEMVIKRSALGDDAALLGAARLAKEACG